MYKKNVIQKNAFIRFFFFLLLNAAFFANRLILSKAEKKFIADPTLVFDKSPQFIIMNPGTLENLLLFLFTIRTCYRRLNGCDR